MLWGITPRDDIRETKNRKFKRPSSCLVSNPSRSAHELFEEVMAGALRKAAIDDDQDIDIALRPKPAHNRRTKEIYRDDIAAENALSNAQRVIRFRRNVLPACHVA